MKRNFNWLPLSIMIFLITTFTVLNCYAGKGCSDSISLNGNEDCNVCGLREFGFDWTDPNAKKYGYICGVDIYYIESEGFTHEIDSRTNYLDKKGKCKLYDGKKSVFIRHKPTNNPEGGRYKTKVCFYYKWGENGELCNSCEPCPYLGFSVINKTASSSYSANCFQSSKKKKETKAKRCKKENDCTIAVCGSLHLIGQKIAIHKVQTIKSVFSGIKMSLCMVTYVV